LLGLYPFLDNQKTNYWDFIRTENGKKIRYIIRSLKITFDWSDEEACFQFEYWCWIKKRNGNWMIYVY
jgi:hypothetical protein